MTKPVSKTIDAANPTQLDGAKDKAAKKPKSTKRVNQPMPANPVNSSNSVNSENPLKIVKSRSVAIDPNLFADELVPSVTSEGTREHHESIGGSSTDSKSESVELNPTNSPDEKRSSDGDVALDLAPPVQSEESDSITDASSYSESSSLEETASQSKINPLKEMDSSAELTSTEGSAESDELNELAKSDESNSDIALNSTSEPKLTRVSAKMRRQELDDYVERFLQPGQIAKRHTVVIEEETWKRISYNVRKIGLEDSTGSAYVEAILRDHLDGYEGKVEEWRKL